MKRRAFGSIRALPSGRLQARYLGPDGLRRTAPFTFATRSEARRWLAAVEVDLSRGTWEDLHTPGEPLQSFAARWIAERPGLSERSVALYESLLRLHIAPTLGHIGLRQITPSDVRSWRQALLDRGVGQSTTAKAYRLLRAMLNTAVDDERIRRNPARIRGAGVEQAAERPVLTVQQVMDLARAIEPRYRLLVLLAVFASLRWGELIGLRRSDVDMTTNVLHVRRSVSTIGARLVVKEPKTRAGRRSVAFPSWLRADIEAHFEHYSEAGKDGRVFVGAKGATPHRANFSPVWAKALADAGLHGIHVHDLRHTGNHFAAISGASTRELMGRMGHVSVDAALVYQHRTASRDRAIAEALDQLIQTHAAEQQERLGHAEGTDGGESL